MICVWIAPNHLINAASGSPEDLVNGVSKAWLIEKIKLGYPEEVILNILEKAVEYAFEQKNYALSYEIYHRKERYDSMRNANEFSQFYSLLLEDIDSEVADYIVSTKYSRSITQSIEMATAMFYKDNISYAMKCWDIAKEKAIMLEQSDPHNNYYKDLCKLKIILDSKFAPKIEQEAILDTYLHNGLFEELLLYISSITGNTLLAEDTLLRIAIIKNISIKDRKEFQNLMSSNYVLCIKYLLDMELQSVVPFSTCDVVTEWVDGINTEYIFHRWFFYVIASFLMETEIKPAPSFEHHPEWMECFNILKENAINIGKLLENGEELPYALLILKDISDYEYVAFKRALVLIASDLYLINILIDDNYALTCDDIKALTQMPNISIHSLIDRLMLFNKPFLVEDSIYLIRNHLNNKIMTASDGAETLLTLITLYKLHDLPYGDLQEQYLHYALGYDYKDDHIRRVLESLVYLSKHSPQKSMELLVKIAPSIQYLGHYAYETPDIEDIVDELLFSLDKKRLFIRYYEMNALEDWNGADELLNYILSSNTEDYEIYKYLVQTGLNDRNLSALSNNRQLYDLALKHLGKIALKTPTLKEHSVLEPKEIDLDYSLYPPEKISELPKHSYNYQGWYQYWVEQNRELDLFNTLIQYLPVQRHGHIDRLLAQLYESSKKLKGSSKETLEVVKKLLKDNCCWLDAPYYQTKPVALEYIAEAAKAYPKKAHEILKSSCIDKFLDKRQIPGVRLVFYLLELKDYDSAIGLVEAIVNTLLEDNLHLSLPNTIWQSALPKIVNEVFLLIGRLRIPNASVKWWTIQALSKLLFIDKYHVEEQLLWYIEICDLEIHIVEVLSILHLATTKGYKLKYDWSQYVKNNTSLAELLMSELGYKTDKHLVYSNIVIQENYDLDIESYHGSKIPYIYLRRMQELEECTKLPFIKQYSYVIKQLIGANHNKLSIFNNSRYHPPRGYVSQPADVIKDIGISAYLHTIRYAEKYWKMPSEYANNEVLMALPTDPLYVDIKFEPSITLPTWEYSEVSEKNIHAYILNILTQKYDDFPIHTNIIIPLDNETIKITATLHAIFEDEFELHECNIDYITRALYPLAIARPQTELAQYGCIPLSVPWWGWQRYGYAHCEIMPLHGPISTTHPILATPKNGRIFFNIDDQTIAETHYWNSGWNEYFQQNIKPNINNITIAKKTALSMLWTKTPISYRYYWTCTHVSRTEDYHDFECNKYSGNFPYEPTIFS